METRYQVLLTLYSIVKNDPQPTSYNCRPREIILRQWQDWSVIVQHVILLQEEGLVLTEQRDTLLIKITAEGIQKALLLNEEKDISSMHSNEGI